MPSVPEPVGTNTKVAQLQRRAIGQAIKNITNSINKINNKYKIIKHIK